MKTVIGKYKHPVTRLAVLLPADSEPIYYRSHIVTKDVPSLERRCVGTNSIEWTQVADWSHDCLLLSLSF